MKLTLFVLASGTLIASSSVLPSIKSYPRVESYVLRPGIVATPHYDKDGTLCEVSFEKRHVQADVVDMESTMPREAVLEVIDELAPPAERGKSSSGIQGHDYLDHISGQTAVAIADFEKVAVQIHHDRRYRGDVAAIVTWKNVCGGWPRPVNTGSPPQE